MKFGITQFEKLALTSQLVNLPSPNPEYGRRRLRTWDELGVAGLADGLAMSIAIGVPPPSAAEWVNNTTPVLVDLSPDIVDHILQALGGQVPGVWSDTLTRVRNRLEQLRDKKYVLPPELMEPSS